MEFKYVFKQGQGIQGNDDNTTFYIVQKDVVTNDANEMVPVKVMTEAFGSSESNMSAKALADLAEKYDSWMAN